MKAFKKITVKLILMLIIFATCFVFNACFGSKDDGKSEDDIIFIVPEDVYKKSVQTGILGLSGYDHLELDAGKADYITENETYYAVVRILGKSFKKAKFYLEGDVTAFNSLIMPESVYTSKYDSREKAFNIERKYDTGNNYFYAAIKFTISRDYSGIPLTAYFEYTTDAESEEYENTVKVEKDIRVLRKADTVSSIGYLTESDYQSGDYEDKIKDRIEIAVGEKCYVVIDYTLSGETEINETDMANLAIRAYGSLGAEYELKVEALPTTVYETIDNAVYTTFKIHDSVDEGKSFRFIVAVTGRKAGLITVYSEIYGQGIFFVGGRKATGSVIVSADLELESKLSFTLSDDETYYIVTGLGDERSDTVTVPAMHKGLPVKEIDSFVFMESNHIKNVILNEGLEKIGASAFKNCTSLLGIVIPESVTYIGKDAFNGCNASICCIAETKPSDWNERWAPEGAYVTWNSDKHYVLNGDGKSYSYTAEGLNLTDVKILSEYKNLPVTAITDGAFKNYTSLKTVYIPESIKTIGKNAFENCTGLTKIAIPDSVEEVGDYAFYGCVALKTADLGNSPRGFNIGEYVFANCTELTGIAIPDSLYTISKGAFKGCTSLKTVSFGTESCLDTVGVEAFASCTGLKSIALPNDVSKVGAHAFENCTALETANLGSSLYVICVIEDYAFSGCSSLTEVSVSDKLQRIGEYAFVGCSSLTEISLPDSLKTIGKYAFNGCAALETVIFTENSTLENIDDRAFENCVKLFDIKLGDELVGIGKYAFAGCTSLSSIKIAESVEYIDASAFYLCTGLNDVTIQNGITYIGNSAFSGCTGIISLTLPNSITEIGENAFFNCTGLTEINLPSRITFVSYGLFTGCEKLKSITIPAGVQTINDEAFSGCTLLESVAFLGENALLVIDEKAFYNCVSLTELILPSSLQKIEYSTFENCTSLTSVTIGANMKYIRYHAFYNCTELTEINYKGSEQQWAEITFGNDFDRYDNNGVNEKINYTLNFNYTGK